MDTETLLRGLPTEKILPIFEDGLFEQGGQENLDKVVLANMREAFFYARHCCRAKLPEDVIYSAVYLALAHASRNYRPGIIRFFAYAKPYIRGAICKEWKALDVVKNAQHESLLVPDFDVAEKMNHSSSDGTRDDPAQIQDYRWEVEEHVEPEFGAMMTRERMELIRPILQSSLSDHERTILELKYFAAYNFEEIGRMLGVTRSAIQNSHTRALRKIRAVLLRKRRLFNE